MISQVQGVMHSTLQTNDLLSNIMVFVLACVLGYYIIWRVSGALHAPLLGVTNVISSIIIVACLKNLSTNPGFAGTLLCLIALFLVSINIFGGYYITAKMLNSMQNIKRKK
ncbi:MAG: hypothetical protein C0432_04785 [Candidatus Puniceispirillum sp.]|nr:hypothetical protein [Candidatus Pelagibacter sp.]MBA4283590.1 hypothetical protein [Candidatus Puniceispirillum sp.]